MRGRVNAILTLKERERVWESERGREKERLWKLEKEWKESCEIKKVK